MNTDAFRQRLAAQGYTELVSISREPNAFLHAHAHAPESKALITAGEMWITIDGDERRFKVGDEFHLKANEVHAERYGADGVTYLVGRRPIA